jgi:cell division protein FtsI/penicillin-binding protein 2
MKKSNKKRQNRSVRNRTVFFRLGMLALVLFAVGMVTAIAKYKARSAEPAAANPPATATNKPAPNFVTIEMNGKKLQVDAQTLQQGPLTQTQAQQIADALKDNKSTDGLVQVQNPDGSVSTDLQGRFQNVLMARKNDDGSVSQACVDNPEAAGAFLNGKQPPAAEPGAGRPKTVAPAKAVAEQ